MYNAFLQAALLVPPCICGVQLLPLSAGRALILEAIGSPFWFRGSPVDHGSVLTFLFFCSHSMVEGRRVLAMADSDRAAHCAAWVREIGLQKTLPLHDVDAVAAAVVECRAYVAAYMDVPRHVGGGGQLRAPTLWAVAVGAVVASKGAVTLAEAWEMGIAEASCLASTAGDLAGNHTLETESMRAAAENVHRPNWRREIPADRLTPAQVAMQRKLDARRRARGLV